MGDGINFNKMTFQQKVQQATQNLNLQGKTAPTTADIVNEMVRMAKEDSTQLPEGYRIEHTAPARAAQAADITLEVYGVPGIPGSDIPQDVSKFLDFIMELITQIDKLPPEIKSELIDILTEYVDALENGEPITEEPPQELYGTPVIDDISQQVLKLLQKLNDMGIPSEVIAQIMEKLNECMNDPSKLNNLIDDIAKLLHNAGLSNEQINEILNDSTLIEIQNPAVVYGTPDIPDFDPTENVKKLLDFIDKLSSMDLPPELLSSIVEELKNIPQAVESGNLIDILDNITAKINETNLTDDKKAALMEAISDFLNEYNNDVIGTICVYGTPDIGEKFREIVEKLLPDISGLTELWKEALTGFVKTVIQFLGGSVGNSTGINTTTTGKSLDGTKKVLVANEEEFLASHPADKYEIVHKMPVMGRSGFIIFFRAKEQ